MLSQRSVSDLITEARTALLLIMQESEDFNEEWSEAMYEAYEKLTEAQQLVDSA